MSDNEDWHLEWDNWFDDLDHAVKRMLEVAARAEKEDLVELQYHLIMAASALDLVALHCKDFVNLRVIELQTEIYKQNPLLKLMMELKKNAPNDPLVSLFSSPVARDDSSPPD